MKIKAIALLTACALFAEAQPANVPVPWHRTPEALAGSYVIVELTNATTIEGAWAEVTEDAALMVVEKSGGKDRRRKGRQTILRSEIRRVRFRQRHVRGRVIGTIAGFYAALLIAGAATGSSEALQSGWGIAAVGGAVGGYQLGKSMDKSTRELIIEP